MGTSTTESGPNFPYFVSAVLVALIFLAFSPCLQLGFVGYDDPQYVTENPHVLGGLTAKNIAWAARTTDASNWHPITWLSLELDSSLFGRNPAGFHFTNVALHALAAVLLFMALLRMTNSLWESAFAAAVFALHPLRVESVAWIAERKDVLSAVFWMATILAYARYCVKPNGRSYSLIAVWFVLGLMSKSMLVTLPAVLLLLDYWPLKRMQTASWKNLLKEKAPLFVLSIVFCGITYAAQDQAIKPLSLLPLADRGANALVAYVRYLFLFFWPRSLAPFYPLNPQDNGIGAVLLAGFILVGITLALFKLRRLRYLTVGWLWFLGALVPVIGLMQVGLQSMADRYTYIPTVGLIVGLTWGASEVLKTWSNARPFALVVAVAILISCGLLTYRQSFIWKDNVTLWKHTLALMPENPVALNNLGATYADNQNLEEAKAMLLHSLDLVKNNPLLLQGIGDSLYGNLGQIYLCQGKAKEAFEHLNQSLRYNPVGLKTVHYNLAVAFHELKKDDVRAEAAARRALGLDANYGDALFLLGQILLNLDRPSEAIDVYLKAGATGLHRAEGLISAAAAFGRLGRYDDAGRLVDRGLALKPDDPVGLELLGNIRYTRGDPDGALAAWERSLRFRPNNVNLRRNVDAIRTQRRAGSLPQ